MSRPNVFSVPTRLWNAAEPGGWRTFQQGETDPGEAWSDKEGGETPGAVSSVALAGDLAKCHIQIADLQERLAANGSDMAESAKAREDALAKVAGLEQEVISANTARDEAEKVAASLTAERDAANATAARQKEAADAAEALLAEAAAAKDAAQAAGDQSLKDCDTLRAEIAALKAQLTEDEADVDAKGPLIEQLTALGVKADRRQSVATLQTALDEAKAAAQKPTEPAPAA
jgi:colicin import membrane protein